jgi:hypothetical protein
MNYDSFITIAIAWAILLGSHCPVLHATKDWGQKTGAKNWGKRADLACAQRANVLVED